MTKVIEFYHLIHKIKMWNPALAQRSPQTKSKLFKPVYFFMLKNYLRKLMDMKFEAGESSSVLQKKDGAERLRNFRHFSSL